jgi:signal transduction histidine kinase
MMTAVGLRLETLRGSIDPSLGSDLDQLLDIVSNAVGRLRRLMVELHPRTLDHDGLAAALREHLAISNDGQWTHSFEGGLDREPDPITRHLAYRIALEAMTNARKHARAHRIGVRVRDEGSGFAVTIRDDGIGISPEQISDPAPGHIGLSAMRERAESANGWLTIGPAPDGGTTVEFWLPYTARADVSGQGGTSPSVTEPGSPHPPRGRRP